MLTTITIHLPDIDPASDHATNMADFISARVGEMMNDAYHRYHALVHAEYEGAMPVRWWLDTLHGSTQFAPDDAEWGAIQACEDQYIPAADREDTLNGYPLWDDAPEHPEDWPS